MSGFTKNNAGPLVLIALLSGLIFIPFLGNCPLFDWDEVNFAECAREMVTSGNYSLVQLNYKPFWEKPPVFIWMQAASMNVFGVNEFAARLPNALCSIASLMSIFLLGVRFHSRKFGLIWCLVYVATLLPHLYFRSGLIDPWFNLFIILCVYNCIGFINQPYGRSGWLPAFLAGLFLGLAVLTKGPVALGILALTVLAIVFWTKEFRLLISVSFLVFVITTLLISSSWFLIEYAKGNGRIISEFITYQIRLVQTGDSGHDGPYIYHLVVLLLGCFPASLLFLAAYRKRALLTPYQDLFRKVFICLFWVVLLFFSLVVKTKIVHYSSLCYFPLTFIATIGLVTYFKELKFNRLLKILYWAIAILFTLAFTAIGFVDYIKPYIINSGWIDDAFAVQNIQADVHWNGFEFLIGPLFLIASLVMYRAVNRQHWRLLCYGLALHLTFIYLAIAVIIPKVELYTQHAAIEFYKACSKHNCYVETHGFKSYAYLFYSDRKPGDYVNPDQKAYIAHTLDVMEAEGHSRLTSYATANLFWMEHGKIDRPAFIAIKTKEEKDLRSYPELKKLYAKNGFSFFVRMPAK